MEYFKILIVLMSGILGILALLHLLKIVRMIRLKTTRISDCFDGEVEIKGTIRSLNGLLTSPYSEEACICYNIVVEEKVMDGKYSKWVERYNKIESVPFKVDDGSGEILVSNQLATFELKKDKIIKSGIFTEADYKMANFLKSINIQERNVFFRKHLRVTEKYLKESENVYAIGELYNKDGILKLASNRKKLYISDKSEKELITTSLFIAIGLSFVIFLLFRFLWNFKYLDIMF